MRIFVWLFRAAIFFSLFAFALNNQQTASVKWFFGQEWRAPMVFIVLAAFVLGMRPASPDALGQLDRVLDRSHLLPPGAVESVMQGMKATSDF